MSEKKNKLFYECITDDILRRNSAAATMCHIMYDHEYGDGEYRRLLLRVFGSAEDSDVGKYNAILETTREIANDLCEDKAGTLNRFLEKYNGVCGEAKLLYESIVKYRETNII